MAGTVTTCPACATPSRVPDAASGRPRCSSCHADLPWRVDATSASFRAVVGESPLPVLLDCWAPWCGPCRVVGPAVERMAERYAGRLKVVKLNVDEAPDVAAGLGVQGIPALFLVHGGTIVDEIVGAVPEHVLAARTESVLSAVEQEA